MILVDIYVPSIGMEYDFKLEQDATVASIIEEVTEMITQKEHLVIIGNGDELALCSSDTQAILPPDAPLAACGIRTGSRLILV